MPANIAGLNNSFIRAEQFVHQAIANKSKDTMSIWRDMIELGNFEYGRGYMIKPQRRRFSIGRRQRSRDHQPTPWQALLDPGELPRFEAASKTRAYRDGNTDVSASRSSGADGGNDV